jgi:maltooligosyltrehalose synthase
LQVKEAIDSALHQMEKSTLFELLGMQSFRLCYWKMASDEINYRRFFEINDLMSIRMETEEVFEEAHKLINRLLTEGKITGNTPEKPHTNTNRYPSRPS